MGEGRPGNMLRSLGTSDNGAFCVGAQGLLRCLVNLRTVILVLLLAAVDVSAAPCQPGTLDEPTFVSPPQQPTEATIGAYLIGLERVSGPSEP